MEEEGDLLGGWRNILAYFVRFVSDNGLVCGLLLLSASMDRDEEEEERDTRRSNWSLSARVISNYHSIMISRMTTTEWTGQRSKASSSIGTVSPCRHMDPEGGEGVLSLSPSLLINAIECLWWQWMEAYKQWVRTEGYLIFLLNESHTTQRQQAVA